MKLVSGSRRVGIAELTGSLLMIALTIVAGAAVFAWVNSQAGVSEGSLGQNAANQSNYYHESFVVVSIQFSYYTGSSTEACQLNGGNNWCNQVQVAVYNNGQVGLTIQSIVLASASTTSASGTAVPLLSVTYALTSATAGTYNVPSYKCASNTGPPPTVSENLLQTGVSEPIAMQSSPPTLFTFTLPSSCWNPPNSGILDGALYSVQVVGLYGNTVTSEVTANG